MEVQEIPYDRFRRTTAKRMAHSITTKPQLTLHRHAELTALEAALRQAKAAQPDVPVGFTAALLVSIARSLTGSRLNGTVDEQVISLHRDVHLGVAVDVDGALLVPVLRNANKISVAQLEAELKRLAHKARTTGLRPDDVAGATFTVSSLGPLGVELFTPIINPPQLAILGLGAVRDELTLVDGEPVAVRRLGLSLTFDHAATDGAEAARVLGRVCESIESPGALDRVAGTSPARARDVAATT
ncbi:2-oxo acid dehydrogenase subunit E2 [Nocardioides caldifontis]|uniref:2-oxo acid dehydrogenase subunit E2 n=1 Tax=Nocardioides caldifontis TaxID=2588938 RepID=UPI001396C9FB|nr:2-oxo acid dehydrogenase subunit E2 [Nocardioides caldifontis]